MYTQKPKEAGEDDEPVEDEEEGAAKKKFDLVWQADTKISASAFLVNSVEQWEIGWEIENKRWFRTWIVLFYKYTQFKKFNIILCIPPPFIFVTAIVNTRHLDSIIFKYSNWLLYW